jgi:hypothetical protein
VRIGNAGGARFGQARCGVARQVGHGLVRQGVEWQGRNGMARNGAARSGLAWQGRLGMVWRGTARSGAAGNFNERDCMKYAFRDGSRVSNISPQVVGNELDRIHEKHGALKPTNVVEEARPEEAPLHPVFEWNDSIAAEEWRLHTARNLIRSVQVITSDNQKESVYVSVVTEHREREYQPLAVVAKSPDLYAEAVYEAQQRIKAAKKSLDDLQRAAEHSGMESAQREAIKAASEAIATASNAVEVL